MLEFQPVMDSMYFFCYYLRQSLDISSANRPIYLKILISKIKNDYLFFVMFELRANTWFKSNNLAVLFTANTFDLFIWL